MFSGGAIASSLTGEHALITMQLGMILRGVGPGLDNFTVVKLLVLQGLLTDVCLLMPTC